MKKGCKRLTSTVSDPRKYRPHTSAPSHNSHVANVFRLDLATYASFPDCPGESEFEADVRLILNGRCSQRLLHDVGTTVLSEFL